MAIIQQLIKNDGGRGAAKEIRPSKLNCFAEVMNGTCDATWVFMGWEGVEATRSGNDLNVFKLTDYDVPYGYSPLLLAHPKFTTNENSDGGKAESVNGQSVLRSFLAATAKGYDYAASHPEEGAEILQKSVDGGILKLLGHNTNLGKEFLLESQRVVGKTYLNANGLWGVMDPARSERFVDWLTKNELLADREGRVIAREELDVSKIFTNHFLPSS